MKKFLLFFLLPLLAIALLASCGSSKSSDDGGTDGDIIKSDKFGYSVLVPDEFKHGKEAGVHHGRESARKSESSGSQQQGESDEECQGYGCDGYEFNICARTMNYIGGTTPEQSVKQSFEMNKSFYGNAKAKMLDDTSYYIIGEKYSKLEAYIEFQLKGKKFTITMNYPVNERDEFEEVVEAVIDSFEVK
ncbi:MAG: hypothetical protein IKW83_03675 [Muribaculaceae bacterium]|nr:hypothetical protein [Muribaculaceae bacterium]